MSDAKLEEMLSLMRELVKWTKFGGKRQLRAMIVELLMKDSEKLVYEYSDGERSVRDIEEVTHVGKTTVAKYWEKWLALGIVEVTKTFQGRMRHICSLQDVGIEVPKIQGQVDSLREEEEKGVLANDE